MTPGRYRPFLLRGRDRGREWLPGLDLRPFDFGTTIMLARHPRRSVTCIQVHAKFARVAQRRSLRQTALALAPVAAAVQVVAGEIGAQRVLDRDPAPEPVFAG
jgi:hypothetical protein